MRGHGPMRTNKVIFLAMGIGLTVVPLVFSQPATPSEVPLPKRAQVTGDFLRVRQNPGQHEKVVGVLFKNMLVDILARGQDPVSIEEKKDWWFKVKADGITGWVFGGYLDFTLANKNKSTYDGNPDITWFFKKYGESTGTYDKLKPEDFTLDQYRSLLSAAVSKEYEYHPSLIYALLFSAYREYKKSPNTPRMAYLQPILFSPKILRQMLNQFQSVSPSDAWIFDDILDAVPAEKWADTDFIHDFEPGRLEFKRVSPALRDNETFMFPFLSEDACLISFASERLLANKAFLMSLPTLYGVCYGHQEGDHHISEKLWDDPEFAVKACANAAPNLRNVSDRLKNDMAFWTAIIRSSTPLTESAYDRYGGPSPAFDSDEITNPDVIVLILQSSDLRAEFFAEALSHYKDDRPTILKIVKADGKGLSLASERLQNDKEVVYWAVKDDSASFEYASRALKDDQNYVKDLIKFAPGLFQFASERLRSDREIAQEVVRSVPSMVNYVTGPLVGDENLAVLAMEGVTPEIFSSLPEWVKTNVKAAIVYQERISHQP